jgi:predicted Zn-dependent peptidase
MRRISATIPALLLLASAVQPSSAQTLHIAVQKKVLDNGVTVLVWERPSAGRIGTRVFYRVDIAAERPGTVGLTHMLEHHLFKGSDVAGTADWEAERAIAERVERLELQITDEENRNRDCFRQRDVFEEVEAPCRTPRLDSLRAELTRATEAQNRLAHTTWYDWAVQGAGGTNSTASTGRDWMKFDIDLPASKLELFMWTERNRLEHPVFRHFEPEKEVVVDQIRRYDNRPDGPFARVLRSMTYDAHPYGWAHWFSDLTRATREDHWEIFHRFFIPQNTILVVVGEVKAEEVFRLAEAYWGSWRPGRPSPRLRTVEPPPVGQKRLTVDAAAGPTVAIHVPLPAVGHPDGPVFEILAELLGGPQGLLTRELVSGRAIATQAGASGWMSKYPSHFELRVDARSNDDLDAVEAGINTVLERIAAGGVPALDVEAAASRLVLGLARSLDEIGSSAVTIGSMEAIHRWDHLNELPALWNAVTPEDLAGVARRYFAPHMQTVGVLRRTPAGAAANGSNAADLLRVRPGTWPYGGPVGEWFLDPVPARAAATSRPRDSDTSRPGDSDVTGSASTSRPQDSGSAPAPSAGARTTHVTTAATMTEWPLPIAEQPWYAPPWLATRRPTAFAAPPPVRDLRALRFEPGTFTPPAPAEFRVPVPGGPATFVIADSLLPVVQVSVLIAAPATAEAAGREGIGLLTSELLLRSGTAARTADQVQAALDRLGATIRVSSDRNRTRLHAVAPAAAADSLLGIVAEIVSRPRLESVFEAERNRVALRAARARDDAGARVRALFETALYGEHHPYGRRATAESVHAIGLDDVRAFHARHYAADRVAFAVSGAVDPDHVARTLAHSFASPAPIDASPSEPSGSASDPDSVRVVMQNLDTRQGHVMIGHLGIEGRPQDHAALEVMHHILAGGGFISRMMELLRTQTGITSALYGEVEPGRGTRNPYVWRFSGNPETLARGVRLAVEEIRRMRDEGVTPEEFEAARTAYIDGLIPASYDTPHKTAERFAHHHLFGLYAYQSPQYLNYYAGDAADLDALRRLTLDDVNRAARQYLHPDHLVITVVGPLETIREAAGAEERALLGWR